MVRFNNYAWFFFLKLCFSQKHEELFYLNTTQNDKIFRALGISVL